MLCRDVVARTTDYLENALSELERSEWDEHSAECLDCARYIAQLCLTVRLIARMRWPADGDVAESCVRSCRE